MTQQFYTVLTHAGAAALANAKALGQDLPIAQFAVGTGGGATYNPTVETLKAATTLTDEQYRGGINELKVDPKNPARYYVEGVVPVATGGWTVREAGWFLEDGTLFAITNYPASYKSIPADGVATELPVRTYIATGSAENMVLKIDPTVVLATRAYVTTAINEGKTDDYTGQSSELLASQKAVNYAYKALHARFEVKPLSLSQHTAAANTYIFDAENLTATLPDVTPLPPYVAVKLRRSPGIQSGMLVPFNAATTQLIAEDTSGALHTDTELLYSTPEPITATLNSHKNWEITRD